MDENLSVALPSLAHARGYEATHGNYLGLRQAKDWDILTFAQAGDWIIVTCNVLEFPSRYRKLELHPGVVFIVPVVLLAGQIELFGLVLDAIDESGDMTNKALELTYADDRIRVSRYDLP